MLPATRIGAIHVVVFAGFGMGASAVGLGRAAPGLLSRQM